MEIPVNIGIDEAGRGCAWGSVFAGAVVLPDHLSIEDEMDPLHKQLLRDSKKLSKKRRMEARELIHSEAIAYATGETTANEIDTVNILNATFTAMHRAIDKCIEMLNEKSNDGIKYVVNEILVDGNRFRLYIDGDGEPINHQCIVGGDASERCIAAASILAKTSRDMYIDNMVEIDPDIDEKWGMLKHKGYCTKQHITALREHGCHPMHRKSYGPVKAVM